MSDILSLREVLERELGISLPQDFIVFNDNPKDGEVVINGKDASCSDYVYILTSKGDIYFSRYCPMLLFGDCKDVVKRIVAAYGEKTLDSTYVSFLAI